MIEPETEEAIAVAAGTEIVIRVDETGMDMDGVEEGKTEEGIGTGIGLVTIAQAEEIGTKEMEVETETEKDPEVEVVVQM